tara:strand:- start:339 stop:692 length:354 start_codon:yes stop_codon:yes gene_type:complete
MALGNNAGKGTARHKGQTIRSIKQRRVAKDYTEIQASAVQGSSACSESNLNVTYYHDGSHVSGLPVTAGDKIYTRKRANSKFHPVNGHIKVGPDRGRYSNIQVQDGAVRAPGGVVCP